MHESPHSAAPRRRSILAPFLLLALSTLAAAPLPASAGTWRSITPQGAAIRTLAASASRSGVVYAATERGEVYGSEDGAASWSLRSALPPAEILSRLAVDPVRPEVVYARSSRGLVRSADGGRSWSVLLDGRAQPVGPFALARSNPRVFYATRGRRCCAAAMRGRPGRWSRASPAS